LFEEVIVSKTAEDQTVRQQRRADGKGGTELSASPMMLHLMDALEQEKDIGHYGRLTFVMVARFFLQEDEMVHMLTRDPDCSEAEARELIAQVKGHGYNPPKRERILQWQREQDFPICPSPDDPASCNVYSELRFPDEVYENIGDFWEEKSEAQQSR
jgi:hypothetical protein